MSGYQPQGYDPRQGPPVTPPAWQGHDRLSNDQWRKSVEAEQAARLGRPQYPHQQQLPPGDQGQPRPQDYAPYQPQYIPPRRRRSRWPIGAAAGIIVLALAGGAFYVMHSRAAAGPLTCAQQYTAWKNGPANADGKQLEAAAASLSADGKTEDIPAMDADLKTLGTDAARLEAYPMPACADPAGYWEQYLGQMKAAGDNAGTATGLGGLILAEAPLKQVPAIQSKLTTELAKTAGVKAS